MDATSESQYVEQIDAARRLNLHFEVCPTSNVHTATAASLESHPLRAMIEAGLSASVSTDNRLMSGVTMSSELQAVHDKNSVSLPQLGRMMREAARVSFMPAAARDAAIRAMDAWPR